MPEGARTHYHACNSGRGCASAGVDLDLATRGAYEDGKGDGRVEGRREAAEEVERLQLLLDQAEQYARDLQDGSAPGIAAEVVDLGSGYHELDLGHDRWYWIDELGARVLIYRDGQRTFLRWKPLGEASDAR